jgi:hypothetical protein
MNLRIASEGACVEIQTAVIPSFPEDDLVVDMWRVNYASKGHVLRTEAGRSKTSSSASRNKKGYASGECLFLPHYRAV